MTLAGLLSESSVFPISWAVCSSSLASHLAMSPAPTSVTGGAVCAAPGTAISTAAVHDSSIATVIEASSSSVDFFILLPLHKGGTRQPRLKLYNAPTLATIGTRRITQLQYLLHLSSPTSENSVTAKFADSEFSEVRTCQARLVDFLLWQKREDQPG